MHHRNESRQGGFTVVELVVVAALLGLLVSALATLSSSGGDAQQYANRLNRATELTQDLIDQVRGEMVSAVRLFGDDDELDDREAALTRFVAVVHGVLQRWMNRRVWW